MIIYFYLLIPLLFLSGDSSSIKGRNNRNDIGNSKQGLYKRDNSVKLFNDEPFLLQLQVPKTGEKMKGMQDGKKQRGGGKKRATKFNHKPMRKKFRKRRDVNDKIKPREETDITGIFKNSTKVPNNRIEILKALTNREEMKNKFEGVDTKIGRNNTSRHVSNKLSRHRKHNYHTTDKSPIIKMIYPTTPKTDRHLHKYTYKDLMADRERLEQKIKYIKNMLNVNDTADDPVRIRRRSESDRTANKIAKMFLTLSAVNGLHDRKKSKCEEDDDDRVQDVWEKERKSSPTRKSTSSNEERYKVKKWIEFMKSKRSSSKICPCMESAHGEDSDAFPLEQKLPKGYFLMEKAMSSEESSESVRDPFYYPRDKFGRNSPYKRLSSRNQDDYDTKIKLPKSSKKKIELPLDDLELYRSRAKQILQNAEEILDRIKEEEEKRLSAPNLLMSHIKELTSRIQGDPRNNENDLIRKIQKNLGWSPLSKTQEGGEPNSFLENVKSYILDPYEKAKALTDESTKKLSSYLLRNLGKLQESSEEVRESDDEKGESGLKMYFGQLPRKSEDMPVSANLAKEEPGLDKHKEELQHWEGTLSAMLGGNDETPVRHNHTDNNQEEIKARMENIMKEQQKKLEEYKASDESSESKEIKGFNIKQVGKDLLEKKQSGASEKEKNGDENQSSEIKDILKDILKKQKTQKTKAQDEDQNKDTVRQQTPEVEPKEDENENKKLTKAPGSKKIKVLNKKPFAKDILKKQKSPDKVEEPKENQDIADTEKLVESAKDTVGQPKENENQEEEKVEMIKNAEKSAEDVDDTVEEKQLQEEEKVESVQKAEKLAEEIEGKLEENEEEEKVELVKDAGKSTEELGDPVEGKQFKTEEMEDEEKVESVKNVGESKEVLEDSVEEKQFEPEEMEDEEKVESVKDSEKSTENSEDAGEDSEKGERVESRVENVENIEDITEEKQLKADENEDEEQVESVREAEKSSEDLKETAEEKPFKTEVIEDGERVESIKDAEKSAEGIEDMVEEKQFKADENEDGERVESIKDAEKSAEGIEDMVEEKQFKADENEDGEKVESIKDAEKSAEGIEDIVEEKQFKADENENEEKVESIKDAEKSAEEIEDGERVESIKDTEKSSEDMEGITEEKQFKAEDNEDKEKVEAIKDAEKSAEDMEDQDEDQDTTFVKNTAKELTEDMETPKENSESEDEKQDLLESVDGEKDSEKLEEINEDDQISPKEDEENDSRLEEVLEAGRQVYDDVDKVGTQLGDGENSQEKSEPQTEILQEPEMNNQHAVDTVSVERKDDESGETLQQINEKQSKSSEELEQTNDPSANAKETDDQEDFAEKNLSEEFRDKMSDYESLVQGLEKEKNELKKQQNSMEEQESNEDENVQMQHISQDETGRSEETESAESLEENSDETLKSSLKETDSLEKDGQTDSVERSDENVQTKSAESREEPTLEAEHNEENTEGEMVKSSEEVKETSKDDAVVKEENPNDPNNSDQLENSMEDKTSEESNEEKTLDVNGNQTDNLQEAKPIQEETADTQDQTLEDNQEPENEETMVESENPVTDQEKDYENNEIDGNEIAQMKAADPAEDEKLETEENVGNSQKSEETETVDVNDEDPKLESKKDSSVEEKEVEEGNLLQSSNPEQDQTEISSQENTEDENLQFAIKGEKALMPEAENMEVEDQNEETVEQQNEMKEDPKDADENIDDESLVASKSVEDSEKVKEIYDDVLEKKSSSQENPADDKKDDYLENSEETVRAQEINELSNEIDENSAEDFYPKAKYYSRESEDDNLQSGNPTSTKDESVEDEFARLSDAKQLKLPKSIGEIMKDLGGKEKQDINSIQNLNPKKIDDMLDKIDEAEQQNLLESWEVDCRKECACADEIDTRSRNIGRYEIVKDFLHWMKDLQLNRVLTEH